MSENKELGGAETFISFGPFLLYPARKLLMEGSRPVRLGSRALEILIALIENAGNIVTTEKLLKQVWPTTIVDENSVRVHMSSLRKTLHQSQDGVGEQFITNIPGRGYLFAKEVVIHRQENKLGKHAAEESNGEATATSLPMRLTSLIGRESAVHDIGKLLQTQRMVSLVGPGGIGKTSVALAVAENYGGQFAAGTCFVDLAPITEPGLVPTTLALALRTSIPSQDPVSALCILLRDSQILLILDNCEHVIDAVAQMVERLLAMAPNVHILATSREALYTAGEWIHHLRPLAVPDEDEEKNVGSLLQFSAIQLFVERASANATGFEVNESNLGLIARICRQLDGMPLAIELAAARAESLGVEGLVSRFTEIFELLTRGRRTARPRHQNLEALLDWSVHLLTKPELIVLQRLSVFQSGFTIDCAVCVCRCPLISSDEVMEIVMSLSAKSLISSEVTEEIFQHRLLNITRLYAKQLLEESGETESLALAHAKHMMTLLKQAEFDLVHIESRLWRATYRRVVDDLRSALDWAFSGHGDDSLGVELTIAALYPAIELVMLEEYQNRIDQALESLKRFDPPRPDLEVRLYSAMGIVGAVTGNDFDKNEVIYRLRGLALGEALPGRQLELLYIATVAAFGGGDYPVVLELAGRSLEQALSLDDGVAQAHANRFLGYAYHFLGNHNDAKRLMLQALENPTIERQANFISQVPFSVSMRIVLARVLWLQGYFDQARQVATEAVNYATGKHPFAICQALSNCAIPIALWCGDDTQARIWNDILLEKTGHYSLAIWHSWGRGFWQVLEKRGAARGESEKPFTSSVTVRSSLYGYQIPYVPIVLDMLATLEPAAIHDSTWLRVQERMVGWCAPEVMRVRGEHIARSGVQNSISRSEELYLDAFELAREQGAVAWQLRSATSLLQMWSDGERKNEAVQMLRGVLQLIPEGAGTNDVTKAQELLAQCNYADLRLDRA